MSDALAAALMATQQQRRRQDPSEATRKYGQALLQQGSSVAPVQSPMEGLARALQGGVGGFFEGQAERQQDGRDKETMSGLADMLAADTPDLKGAAMERLKGADPSIAGPLMAGLISDQRKADLLKAQGASFGTAYAPPASGGAPAGGPLSQEKQAISAIEGDYNSVGPVANAQGNRAYGKYQVMDFNVGPWTAEVLGKQMTPEEFRANPQAQDRVFEAKFGQYKQQYGSGEAASRAWFAGPNGMNNPNAKDVLGTTVQGYSQKFTNGMAGQPGAPPQAQTAQRPQPSQFNILDPMVNQPQGVLPQGSEPPRADGSGTPMPQPVAPPPAIPEVPRPQPSPQLVQRLQGAISSGAMTRQQAEAALAQEVDREWNVQRDRAKMEFDQKRGEYEYTRNRADKTTETITKRDYDRMTEAEKRVYDAAEYDRRKGGEQQFQTQQGEQKRGDEQTKQKFEFENKLRDDFNQAPPVKAYRVVVPMLESAKDAATRPTRAADLNLVYAFAKLMDPDSVVRESETGAVSATASVADRLGGYLGQLNGNAMLSPETRQKLLKELDSRFNALKSSYDSHEEAYKGIATRNGLNFDNVRVPVRGAVPPQQGTEVTQEEANKWAGGGAQKASPADLKKKYGLE